MGVSCTPHYTAVTYALEGVIITHTILSAGASRLSKSDQSMLNSLSNHENINIQQHNNDDTKAQNDKGLLSL